MPGKGDGGEGRPGGGVRIWVEAGALLERLGSEPAAWEDQRAAVWLVRGLREAFGAERVSVVRPVAGGLAEVAWDGVEAALRPAPARGAPVGRAGAARLRLQQAILVLPPEIRGDLFRAAVLQSQVLARLRGRVRGGGQGRAAGSGPVVTPAAGDFYLVLGAARESVAAARAVRERGARVGVLLAELLALARPEWVPAGEAARLREWLSAMLPGCDVVFTLSQFVADAVSAFCGEAGIGAPVVQVVPAGTEAGEGGAAGMPAPCSYVLCVGTLEARKNHGLLVRVWQRLLDEVRLGQRAAASVPTLVFAGAVGHGVADLMQQLENSGWLGGRVRLFRDPSEAEVWTLLRGCRFSVLPSFYEGWGGWLLASLAVGRPCLAANGPALVEAGGGLCRYFDPDEVGEAFEAVQGWLDAPEALAAWAAAVAGSRRTGSWQAAARSVVEALGG